MSQELVSSSHQPQVEQQEQTLFKDLLSGCMSSKEVQCQAISSIGSIQKVRRLTGGERYQEAVSCWINLGAVWQDGGQVQGVLQSICNLLQYTHSSWGPSSQHNSLQREEQMCPERSLYSLEKPILNTLPAFCG